MKMIKIGNQFISSNSILKAEMTTIFVPTRDDRYRDERSGFDKFLSFVVDVADAFDTSSSSSNSYGVKYPVLKLVTQVAPNEPQKYAVAMGKFAGPTPMPSAGLVFISNKKGFKDDVDKIFKYHNSNMTTNTSYGSAVQEFMMNYANSKFAEIDEDLDSYAEKLFSEN